MARGLQHDSVVHVPIVTLTANPAVDENTSVDEVVVDHKLRCRPAAIQPGGGGINVARAIRQLGGDAVACFPAGGPSGALVCDLLAAEGVRTLTTSVGAWTRENLNVLERSTNRQFRFCAPGGPLDDKEWTALLDRFADACSPRTIAVLSGSLPLAVPADFYARAVARARGARLIVDTSGEALQRVAGRGVYLIKTSLRELAILAPGVTADVGAIAEAASRVVANGACEVLVVSLGAGGSIWATNGQRERVCAPAVPIRSVVGAGDSMVAGIALALASGRPPDLAMRYGVAAGSASVMQPGTSLCRRDDTERLYEQLCRGATADAVAASPH
jgi:6-phosphofructokinase 2